MQTVFPRIIPEFFAGKRYRPCFSPVGGIPICRAILHFECLLTPKCLFKFGIKLVSGKNTVKEAFNTKTKQIKTETGNLGNNAPQIGPVEQYKLLLDAHRIKNGLFHIRSGYKQIHTGQIPPRIYHIEIAAEHRICRPFGNNLNFLDGKSVRICVASQVVEIVVAEGIVGQRRKDVALYADGFVVQIEIQQIRAVQAESGHIAAYLA